MPFKSKAQQRFMFAAESRGDVPKGTAKHWAASTPSIKKLPEKVKRKKHAEVPFLLELPSPDDPRISSYQKNPQQLSITFRNHGFSKKAESDDIESIKPMVPAFPMPPKKLPKAIEQRRFEKSKRRKVKTAMQIVDEVFSKVAARMRKVADGEDGSEYIDPEEVYEFLRNNSHPSDEKVHDWADYNDYDKEKVEEMIYRIAAKNASELIPGGKAEGKPATDYPSEQIQKGIQVEKEHTSNPAMAKEISKDHLEEFPNYYTELGKMEDKMKKSASFLATKILRKVAAFKDRSKRKKYVLDKIAVRKQSAFEDETLADGSSLDMEDPEIQAAVLRAMQEQQSKEIEIPRAHRGLVGFLSAADPLLGAASASVAAPKGRGWAQFGGTLLGGVGGGYTAATIAEHLAPRNLGFMGFKRLMLLARILGTVGGGLLGQRMVGYGKEASVTRSPGALLARTVLEKCAQSERVDEKGLSGPGIGALLGGGLGALGGYGVGGINFRLPRRKDSLQSRKHGFGGTNAWGWDPGWAFRKGRPESMMWLGGKPRRVPEAALLALLGAGAGAGIGTGIGALSRMLSGD